MRLAFRSLALVLAFPAALAAQGTSPVRPVDWAALQNEAVDVLRQYLRIDTSNPPGNELATARFLKAILEKEGIEATILDTAELGDGRANLYARLKGNGSKRAIALVQAERRPAHARHRLHRQRRRGARQHGRHRLRRQACRPAHGRGVPLHGGWRQRLP
jgi:hypothetical protein